MAAQLHNIYSSKFTAAGVVSGGPFYCNQELTKPARRMIACTSKPENIDLDTIKAKIQNLNIDSPENIKDQKVWVYGGKLDSVVVQGVQDKLVEQYLSNGADVLYINDLESEHTFPTDLERNQNECAYEGPPHISNCHFDGVGSMLSHIYPKLTGPRDFDW